MPMFDWNDEELTNIIWGEAMESDDDHIVPYPDQNEENHPVLSGDPTKKDMNHEIAHVSPIEQKKPRTNTEHGVEVVGSCKYGIHEPHSKGFSNSWPDGLEKVDQDSMGTAASNNMMTTKDATGQIDKVSDFLKNPPEDREQGDFVDYGWVNIGSFDDLDRIFRLQEKLLLLVLPPLLPLLEFEDPIRAAFHAVASLFAIAFHSEFLSLLGFGLGQRLLHCCKSFTLTPQSLLREDQQHENTILRYISAAIGSVIPRKSAST